MTPQPPSAEPTVVSRLDADRFCDHCGFNMRTLAVVRDPGTQLLVIRCTECGRHHAAAHTTPVISVLIRRVAPLLTLLWIAALLGVSGVLMLMQTAPQVALHEQLKAQINGVWTLTMPAQLTLMMTILSIFSAGTALTIVTLYTCACHHWRRWGYVLLAFAVALFPLALAYRAWMDDAPDLWPVARPYALMLTGASLTGALAAAFLGRVLVRFVATLLLPPRLRSTLAHLWLADGKRPPRDV
jgi:hypothetical protein